jgi:hypothetical protein
MPTIPAEDVEIEIDEGRWRLFDLENPLTPYPAFEAIQGAGTIEYSAKFGFAHKLPGTILSINYIQAVVIGYDDRDRRWRLGFHIVRTTEDKTRWLPLVRWPHGDNLQHSTNVQLAGRELARYIGCPLKVFGAKKAARVRPDAPGASGVTGPLTPHQREDVGPQQVKLMAQKISLPIEYPQMWLGSAKGGVTLRLAKEITTVESNEIAPAFNQCIIDPKEGVIRLMPPTGLLGTFFSGQQGRVIKFHQVRNVERRHALIRRYVSKEETNRLATEIIYTTHSWGIYLTLADESLLLAQTSHTTSSEITDQRARQEDKFAINSTAGIQYLRQHQADQRQHDAAEEWAESAAVIIAGALGVRLVKTEVEQDTT